jgi:hypothetical protein
MKTSLYLDDAQSEYIQKKCISLTKFVRTKINEEMNHEPLGVQNELKSTINRDHKLRENKIGERKKK